VTNGPLLLVRASGQLPGSVLYGDADKGLKVTLETRVISNEPIRTVELVRDGKVANTASYDAATGVATFATQDFKASGWFLIRTFADREDTFRFASTAPFYVEVGKNVRRVSRNSVKYFITWVEERIARLRKLGQGSDKIDSVINAHLQAKQYWENVLASANAE
jgi:hypothetical protein